MWKWLLLMLICLQLTFVIAQDDDADAVSDDNDDDGDSDSMEATSSSDSDDDDDDDDDDDSSGSMDATSDSDDDDDDSGSGDSDDDDDSGTSDDDDSGDSDDDDSGDSDDDSGDSDSGDSDSSDTGTGTGTDNGGTGTGTGTGTTADPNNFIDPCINLNGAACTENYDSNGNAVCGQNVITGNCYSVVPSQGIYGSGNYDEGYNAALQASVETESQLNAIVATLAVVVALMVCAMAGGGYYVYRRFYTMEKFYKHSSIAMEFEPVNAMSPVGSHQYTVSRQLSEFAITEHMPMAKEIEEYAE